MILNFETTFTSKMNGNKKIVTKDMYIPSKENWNGLYIHDIRRFSNDDTVIRSIVRFSDGKQYAFKGGYNKHVLPGEVVYIVQHRRTIDVTSAPILVANREDIAQSLGILLEDNYK